MVECINKNDSQGFLSSVFGNTIGGSLEIAAGAATLVVGDMGAVAAMPVVSPVGTLAIGAGVGFAGGAQIRQGLQDLGVIKP